MKYRIRKTLLVIALLALSSFGGYSYSNYEHNLTIQAELANTVKLMDCLQGKIKCKVMILPRADDMKETG